MALRNKSKRSWNKLSNLPLHLYFACALFCACASKDACAEKNAHAHVHAILKEIISCCQLTSA